MGEARLHSGTVDGIKEKHFDALTAAEREIAIALLGEKGMQSLNIDREGKKIVVRLSPIFPVVMGCTIFNMLNRLEKLDGALNEMISGKLTLP